MGYPLSLAVRYMGSKKRAFVSVGTAFAMLGVTLGVAALVTVMSVTGGFQEQFRDKVLGVNAHVLVLKYSISFREYRDVMKKVKNVPGVIGVAPFVINPMMVTKGTRTATGVLLKGVDPDLMPSVLDLPKHLVGSGDLSGLRRPGAKPPEAPPDPLFELPEKKQPATMHSENDARPDAGMTTLIDAMQHEVDEEAKHPEAGAFQPFNQNAQNAMNGGAPDAGRDAPVGSVTPTGGYASVLPSDDDIPDSIDPDPCKNADAVKMLPGVVLGKTLAKQLSASVGDCVQITSPAVGMSFGASGIRPPIAKQFRVIATFDAGFDQYDSKLVYTDLYEAQAFYDEGDSVTGVEMKVDDIDHASRIAKQIDKLLNNSVYHTMDWKELNHGLFTALLIQQIGMSFVLALIIVVAAFTVIATLIMVVLEKKKEIALLKALGAKDDAILRVFLYQGAIIGFVGTTVGLALGYICCTGLLAYSFPLDPKVYFISSLPVLVRPNEFIVTGTFAIVICLVATIFPALYAARLRPSDGLRSE
ncbi:MAG: ABC transporter permease [Polyangiaceae bacterium]